MQRGRNCYEHWGRPVGSPNTPADHIESCTNHDPPCTEEVGQSCRRTLSFESSIWRAEQQVYVPTLFWLLPASTHPTLPHVFVYNHHFRNLFNLKYPVDSFGSLTCITIVSMVTSFMARINLMMSYIEITDRLVSTCPIFPSESVQTLFFGESAGRAQKIWSGDKTIVPSHVPDILTHMSSLTLMHTCTHIHIHTFVNIS